MRILVVDDDPAILHLCAQTLRKQGHEVVTCDGGRSAIAAALTDRFDLALCDLNLPDVNGLEIVRVVKMQAPDLPVIVMSALDPREWEPKSAQAGADHFMQKPLRLDILRHEVEMAGASRTALQVALQDEDPEHRQRLETALRQGGCTVRSVAVPLQILTGDRPDLVIVDASAPGAEAVVRWAGASSIHCFVLLEKDQPFDESLMRKGASLIVHKPVDPDALLIQARFLAGPR